VQLLWRKTVNNIMLGLTGLCTFLTVSTLFLILGYLLYYGGRSLDWNFFTKLPLSPGESGGGMANAIVGSMEILAMAALIGIPVGFFAGVYLSEFEDNKFIVGAIYRRPAERRAVDHRGDFGLDPCGGAHEAVFRTRRVDRAERDADPDCHPPN
jgi:hypothetical protein